MVNFKNGLIKQQLI